MYSMPTYSIINYNNVSRLNLVSNSQNWIRIHTEIGNNVLIRYY
ncbi:hypothetical protein NARC_250011 [Candidatus Nitrosocosmicus arcticus]|uniref:Uncharacterized protein n=1 Tax=Candidatus Nitrosocosmicus arcticus TaxID=2035267 RepID=A0A557SQX1_9ARCH|nr:hypothetical protein NARC_250011 [Candidatus Nitrosocosmicus arcticus]